MAQKNKVLTSPHRDEIDKLLLQGESVRNVSKYLKNKYNEIISYATLNNYRKKYLNVTEEAKKIREDNKKLKEAQEKSEAEEKQKAQKSADKRSRSRVNKKAQKLAGNIEELDSIIAEMHEITLDMENIESSEIIDPIKLLQIKLRCKELELKAIKIKYEIYKDDSGPVINVNINEKLDRLKRIEHNVSNSDE